MKRFVAGLDGGGTKTAVAITDESGAVVHAFASGPINFNGNDEAAIRGSFEEIMRIIGEVCGGLDRCEQICIGAAGVSNPTMTARLTSHIRDCGYPGGLLIIGDHETALCGALDDPYGRGIILIAGTGSICYGRNEAGLTHRAGGFGYLIDDEGSGYSIGRDLLAAVVRSEDGRAPKTAIAALVYERLQVGTVREIVSFVYDKKTGKKEIAALAPLLSEACALGDQAAMEIVEKSARSLVELAVPVVEKLSLQEGVLAMAGSVLLKNEKIRNAFRERLKREYPGLSCIAAKKDAESGAVLMALNRLNGVEADQ
jgi:N-acetylglucosamine kinase-like BadF-type ATPase